MKKSIIMYSLMIIFGLVFLILASFNTLNSEILKNVLGGIGGVLIVVSVFDMIKLINENKNLKLGSKVAVKPTKKRK